MFLVLRDVKIGYPFSLIFENFTVIIDLFNFLDGCANKLIVNVKIIEIIISFEYRCESFFIVLILVLLYYSYVPNDNIFVLLCQKTISPDQNFRVKSLILELFTKFRPKKHYDLNQK